MKKINPKLTLERIYIEYPEFYGAAMINRHIARYQWACNYINKEDTVLDAACGTGYGSKMLAEKCRYVHGIDNSQECIEYAKHQYKNRNIEFNRSDLTNDIINNNYDAVISIETIEHFSRTDAAIVLNKFYHVLREKGLLLLSTPNYDDSKHDNICHLKEYDLAEICLLVNNYFKILEHNILNKFIFIVAEKK